MAGPTVGSPRDQGVRLEPLQFCLYSCCQLKEPPAILNVCTEMSVRKSEQNRRMYTERVRCAACFVGPYACQLGTARDRGMRSALRAVCCDDQIHLHTLPSIAGEDRC